MRQVRYLQGPCKFVTKLLTLRCNMPLSSFIPSFTAKMQSASFSVWSLTFYQSRRYQILIPGATQMSLVCCRSDSDEQPMWASWMYRSAHKSLALPGWKQANVTVRTAWISFGALPCKKKNNNNNLMTARVSMLLKSRPSLTFFRACFLPGRAKD